MAIRELKIYPSDILNMPCEEVQEIDDEIKNLVSDMIDTLKNSDGGAGLAAPQVGESKQIFIMYIPSIQGFENGPLVFINPKITHMSNTKMSMEEGCLSFPGLFTKVERLTGIGIKALDINGNEFEKQFMGIPAVCVQHELDHLRGKLFIENLSVLKRRRLLKKYGKMQRYNILNEGE